MKINICDIREVIKICDLTFLYSVIDWVRHHAGATRLSLSYLTIYDFDPHHIWSNRGEREREPSGPSVQLVTGLSVEITGVEPDNKHTVYGAKSIINATKMQLLS